MRMSTPCDAATSVDSGLPTPKSICPVETAGSIAAPPCASCVVTSRPCSAKIPSSMPYWIAADGAIVRTPTVTGVRSPSPAVSSAPPPLGEPWLHEARRTPAVASAPSAAIRVRVIMLSDSLVTEDVPLRRGTRCYQSTSPLLKKSTVAISMLRGRPVEEQSPSTGRQSERSPLQRILRGAAADRDPPRLREGLDVRLGAAVARSGSRGAHATEGRVRLVVHGLVVDVHDARGDPLRQLVARHRVGRDDAERQAVVGVGRDLDGLVVGRERHDRDDGAEHLLREHLRVARRVRDDGRPVEQALVRAARAHLGAGRGG